MEVHLYRYDGSSCLVLMDSDFVSLISRSSIMDLPEAVQVIVLT